MKLICIGDSIVNGFPFERRHSFPARLCHYKGIRAINAGQNGECAEEVLARFDHEIKKGADAVLILAGSNDLIYRIHTPPEIMTVLTKMAQMSIDAGIRPILATPLLTEPAKAALCWMPEMQNDYEQVNANLKDLAERIRTWTKTKGIRMIDLQREYTRFGQYSDGVHPTVNGYDFLAEVIREQLEKEEEQ